MNVNDNKEHRNIGRIVELKGQRYRVNGVWGNGKAYAELLPLNAGTQNSPSVVPTSMINGWLVDAERAKAS